eukprot:TRINITY_DN33086_c0_g1_i1.p1 TRINITY_DN33086_c0_g1~~TRINITY_DN33086_c0_g1_i1.p1  ORF type:complete len:759 (-),score=168.80 TRINITY_DN33086_c0_g1_i1:15-2291(-)
MGQTCTYEACGIGRPTNEGLAPLPAGPPVRNVAVKAENEPWVSFHCNAFRVASTASASSKSPSEDAQAPTGWQTVYSLGQQLGDGISAKVYEAEALTLLPDPQRPGSRADGAVAAPGNGTAGEGGGGGTLDFGSCGVTMAKAGIPQCLRERGRKVAIKRFHRVGSRTFMKELTALRRVGTHPHVLRLLESYQGFGDEDVLVLEYCDGSTLYDLYAREHPKGGLPERLVARMMRQLFLALEHLSNCGIEHQDVKPENMMLFDVSVTTFQAELKLGDFGWAAIAPPPGEGKHSKPPPTGAGSLWYAPPELNPPVEGIEPEQQATDATGEPVKGLSDMWSAGVVLYLLLVGHNPFNQALKQQTPELQDQEVLRLVALGSYNRRTERWLNLHADSRDLIMQLLRVRPMQRSSASEALHHPFVTRRAVSGRVAGYGGHSSYGHNVDGETSVFFHGSVAPWAGRERRWYRLDGLQRLAWLAVARAIAEPELDRAVVQGALEGVERERLRQEKQDKHYSPLAGSARESGYVWQLARELGTMHLFQWLQDRTAWADAVRLAFAYLDVDNDGFLGPRDLVAHFAGKPIARPSDLRSQKGGGRGPLNGQPAAVSAKATGHGAAQSENISLHLATRWIERWEPSLWQSQGQLPTGTSTTRGLSITGFREALLTSCNGDDTLFGVFDDVDEDGIVGEGEIEGEESALGPFRAPKAATPTEGLSPWGLEGGDLGGTGGGYAQGLPLLPPRESPLAKGGDAQMAALAAGGGI